MGRPRRERALGSTVSEMQRNAAPDADTAAPRAWAGVVAASSAQPFVLIHAMIRGTTVLSMP